MNRRDWLKRMGLTGAALTLACGDKSGNSSTTSTTKKVRWRLASSFPRSLDTLFGSAEILADRVRAMTNGNFDIRVYPGGELAGSLEVLDSVQQGSVQVGHSASYYYIGKNPALAFECCVPFGMTARQQAAWLHEGGGLELSRKLFADFNVINFPAGNTGVQMGGWFKREINSLNDMQGLKMRIPGMGGKVMDTLGVAVQTIAGGEIYTALERGAIDATEWVGPYDDEKLGFYKVALFLLLPWLVGARTIIILLCEPNSLGFSPQRISGGLHNSSQRSRIAHTSSIRHSKSSSFRTFVRRWCTNSSILAGYFDTGPSKCSANV